MALDTLAVSSLWAWHLWALVLGPFGPGLWLMQMASLAGVQSSEPSLRTIMLSRLLKTRIPPQGQLASGEMIDGDS